MKALRYIVLIAVLSCEAPTDPHEHLLAGRDTEIRGWIHPWDQSEGFHLLRDRKGREYWIENLPKDLSNSSVQLRAKAKFSGKKNISPHKNQTVISLSDIKPALVEMEKWNKVLTTKHRSSAQFVAALNSLREEIGILLPFWPTSDGEPREDVVGFAWSGCGSLHRVFLKTVSKKLKARGLAADDVFEVNEAGKIVRRWSIPGNDIVHGITGDRLLLTSDTSPLFGEIHDARERPYERGIYLATNTDGKLEFVIQTDEPQQSVSVTCPSIKEFEGSAYTRCAIFKDLASGVGRRLAYQGPCT